VTTSIVQEVERRGRTRRARGRPPTERLTFADDLARRIREDLTYTTRARFPNPRYQRDPVAFFREVLGVEPWSRQIDILNAVRDYPRVAVCSGHKVSKSHSAAGLALWYYCSWDDARIVMSSTTSRQVDQILWRELRILRARAGRCIDCKEEDPEGLRIRVPCPHSTPIEGEQGELARTGLKAPDFREVVGFTARESEAVAGISGRNLLYILDEASGIPDDIFEAIEGNRAGGARIVMFGNGTRTSGEFHAAFTSKSKHYFTLRVSSEETPNVVSGEVLIPGLATRDWIDEKRAEWGEDSPLYKVRIKGLHLEHEEGRIFSMHMIALAEQRWAETPDTGRLYVGVDPAGASGRGDETLIAPRRGYKLLELRAARGLTSEQIVVRILQTLAEHQLPREVPVVVVDRDGPIGTPVYRLLVDHLEQRAHAGEFELVGVRPSDKAKRQPKIYDRRRDELTANLLVWLREGGAIVEDTRLAAEFYPMAWIETVTGKLKVISKDDIRKVIGRSPDRYDALSLACWESQSLRVAVRADAPATVAPERDYDEPGGEVFAEQIIDPYGGTEVWRER
jgi:phage terminase large subunit